MIVHFLKCKCTELIHKVELKASYLSYSSPEWLQGWHSYTPFLRFSSLWPNFPDLLEAWDLAEAPSLQWYILKMVHPCIHASLHPCILARTSSVCNASTKSLFIAGRSGDSSLSSAALCTSLANEAQHLPFRFKSVPYKQQWF